MKKNLLWKVDSTTITNFNASKGELQALILFWILAAGKTAKKSEEILTKLLPKEDLPFEQLEKYSISQLSKKLKSLGCGCFNNKARSIYEIVQSDIDLKLCEASELENVFGIGKKTSRAFILHSRKNAKYAVLDVHILKFLKEKDVPNVPKTTPSSKFEYNRLEKCFLGISRKMNMSPAKLDLKVWNFYSSKGKIKDIQ